MRLSRPLAVVLLAASFHAPLAIAAQPSRTALATGVVAITNVTVVPMTTDRVILSEAKDPLHCGGILRSGLLRREGGLRRFASG